MTKRRWRKVRRTLVLLTVCLFALYCGISYAGFVWADEPIKVVSVPEGTAKIEPYQYQNQTALESVITPASLQTIAYGAFDVCSSLNDVQLHNGLQTIEGRAFSQCTGLRQIRIPDTVTKLGNGSFYGCSSLQDVTLAPGISVMENATFYQCVSLGRIVLPVQTVSIGQQCFYECIALSDVTLPAALQRIEDGAFNGCISLRNITIPDSVQYIGEDAFSNCPAVVFQCNIGSYAYQYAKSKGIAIAGLNDLGTVAVADPTTVPVPSTPTQNVQANSAQDQNRQQAQAVAKTGIRTHRIFVFILLLSSMAGIIFIKFGKVSLAKNW